MCSKCDGPTLEQILGEVVAEQPKHRVWLSLFESNCQSYGWMEGCGCKFWEALDRGLGTSAYCRSHGAESLSGNIFHFLGYFIPRKCCTPSATEMKKAASALRALVKHCVSRGYCEAQPALLKKISASGSFQAENIVTSIQQLADDCFWDSLEDAPQAGEPQPEEFEQAFGDEMPVEIKEVRSDGWVMEPWLVSGRDDFDDIEEVFLRLPPKVARLGRVGAQISCMWLGERNGIWRPFCPDHIPAGFPATVIGNVYPPA